MDVKYKNVVMYAINKCFILHGFYFDAMTAEIVFRGTPPRSPLRRFIAVMIAYCASDDESLPLWMDLIDICPKEDLKQAMKVLIRIRQPMSDLILDITSYLEEE